MSMIQGRHAHLRLGTDVAASNIPIHNWSLQAPRNIVTGQPLGNTWPANWAEGLQTTRFTFNVMLRNNNAEAMALAFWDRFFSRPWAAGIDDTVAFDAFLYTGRRRFLVAGCKAEALTLTLQKGAPVGLSCAFVAPAVPTITDSATTSYGTTLDGAAPLMFDQALFTGLGANVYGLELTYANNHILNAPLNGTRFGIGFTAGVHTAGIAVTVLEVAGAQPIDGVTNATIQLVGTVTRTITLGQILINNPRDVNVAHGPILRTFMGTIIGTMPAGVPTPPIRVA